MKALKENIESRFLTTQSACKKINVSRNTLMRIAGEANAIMRFGKSVRIDISTLYKYIDATYRTKK